MKKKSQRELADEAWLRSQQIDLTGSLENEPVEGGAIEEPDVPRICPHCERMMTLEHGWTISRIDERLICGFCGKSVVVPEHALTRLREQMRLLFEARAAKLAPLPKKGGPRVRGAG